MQHHPIEPGHGAEFGKGRLQRSETFHGCLGAEVLVPIEDDESVPVDHRHYRIGKVSLVPGPLGALLRQHGVPIELGSGVAGSRGNQVGRDALRHEMKIGGEHGVRSGREPGREHGNPRHVLDSATDPYVD